MNWNRLLFHDLRRGIFCRRQIIPFFQFLLLFFLYWLGVRKSIVQITLGDYLFHLFSGLPSIQSIREDTFHLPIIWLQVLACPLYLNMSYPLNDLTKEGEQILIRCDGKKYWFLSKCAWNLCASLTYFLSAIVAAFIMTLAVGGELTFSCSPFLVVLSSRVPMQSEISQWSAMKALVLLPLITITSLNILQMTLSFLVPPIYSFLTCMAVLIASIFYDCPFLLCNGAMLLRSSLLFSGSSQVSASLSGITALLVVLFCIPIGTLIFKKYDVLPSAEQE